MYGETDIQQAHRKVKENNTSVKSTKASRKGKQASYTFWSRQTKKEPKNKRMTKRNGISGWGECAVGGLGGRRGRLNFLDGTKNA